jgi:hypothetical protein
MKTKHLPILASFMLAIAPSPSPAQNPQAVQQIEQRVQQLEAQNDLLEKRLQLKEAELNSAYAQKTRDLEAKVEKAIEQLDEKSSWVRASWALLALVGLGGFIGFPIWIKKKAQEAADKKYDQFFAEEKNRVLKLIEEKDEVVQLKKAKRILVLTPQGGSESFLRGFFLKDDFKSPTYQSFPTPDDFDFSKFDLVLFNDDNPSGFSEKKTEIVETANRFPAKIVCFYFGAGRVNIDTMKFASANFRSQLYGNLLSALHYQDWLKQ